MVHNNQKGAVITLVLAFSLVFLILLGGLLGFVLLQLGHTTKKIAYEQSLHTAEAGAEYYKWCLNNGAQYNCDLEKDYEGPEGNSIGSFSLSISENEACGEIMDRRVYSTGWTNQFPLTTRKVSILYARESVGKYAYLLNDNVWAGSDREIRGLYHSNGGIRMDGENQSIVSSSMEEWVCNSSFGCSSCPVSDGCRIESYSCYCPGVFTTTGNSDPNLFDYPSSYFDFDGITVDLAKIKEYADDFGVYLSPSADIDLEGRGYHVKFINNGSFQVWIVTDVWKILAYSEEDGWYTDRLSIRDEYLYNTYNFDSACPVVFLEDNLWLEGEVKGKVTIASANLINPNEDTNVTLLEDIIYTEDDDGLLAIAENNMLISPDSPDNMELMGIFIAQKGHFGRNHYPSNYRDLLEIYGAVVSNGRVGTQWTSGSSIVSGYTKRENYFDSDLIYFSPPFAPYVSSEFNIVDWEEVED